MIRVLFLGEMIGLETVKKLKKSLLRFKKEFAIDLTIANCDGASDGYGILKSTAHQIHISGVDIITGGDLILNKKDSRELLDTANFIIRPYNLASLSVGRGILNYKIRENLTITVVSLLGRNNFQKIFASDPFYSATKILEKANPENPIIVDFHGGTTSEIQSMHWHLAGKVAAVVGTNLRVLTADQRIINEKTAVITCNGYCGSADSIYGLSDETEITKIKNGQFVYSKIPNENIRFQGVIIDIDETTGAANKIELFSQSADSDLSDTQSP